MKVLVFNASARPLGGTEIYVRTYVSVMRDAGHDVVLVTADSADPGAGVRWLSIASAFDESLRPTRIAASWPPAWKSLARLLDEEKPDVANLHLSVGWQTHQFLLGRLPVVRFVHTAWPYCPAGTRWLPKSNAPCRARPGLGCIAIDRRESCMTTNDGHRYGFKDRARRLLDIQVQGHFFRRAALTVANSRFTAAELARTQEHLGGVRVLYPPVDDLWDAPLEPPPAERKVLLGMGRLEAIKGFDHAVRALRFLPADVSLVLAGDGNERAALERLALAEGVADRVRFTGWLSHQALRAELRAAWAVVFPSLWPEAFGQAGVQALLSARPVVAYDVGGVSEWLGDGEGGALASSCAPEALARAAERLLADRDTAIALGESGRDRAHRLFSRDRFRSELGTILEEATA